MCAGGGLNAESASLPSRSVTRKRLTYSVALPIFRLSSRYGWLYKIYMLLFL